MYRAAEVYSGKNSPTMNSPKRKRYGNFDGIELFTHMGKGMMGMGELIIVTMLAGGLLEIVRVNGGIDYLIQITTAKLKSKKGAETEEFCARIIHCASC